MKNKLGDLNNHLFAQIERLSDEDLSVEEIKKEVTRASAVVGVADTIIRNADVQIKGLALMVKDGRPFVEGMLPMIEGPKK